MPTKGNQVVLEAVIEDFRDKAIAGTEKYGTLLETFNGRDAANDAYQEIIDLTMYFKQLQLEWLQLRHSLIYYFHLLNTEPRSDRMFTVENQLRKMVGLEDVS